MKAFIIITCMAFVFHHQAHAQLKGKSVIVIDPMVRDIETLVKHIEPGTKVVYLKQTKNPVALLTSILKAYAPVRALHIFCEGRTGELVFFGQTIDTKSLEQHVTLLGEWREYFSEGGDILLYGCEVAHGTEGVEFIQALAVHTGLDIAASSNHTGNWRKYGDWLLEIKSGRIEARIAVNNNVIEAYEEILSSADLKNKR